MWVTPLFSRHASISSMLSQVCLHALSFSCLISQSLLICYHIWLCVLCCFLFGAFFASIFRVFLFDISVGLETHLLYGGFLNFNAQTKKQLQGWINVLNWTGFKHTLKNGNIYKKLCTDIFRIVRESASWVNGLSFIY